MDYLERLCRFVADTRWEDIPDDWYCPTCGAEKIDFEMVEID